jgi:hypothetical protein
MRELIGKDTELKYLYDAKAREIDRAIKKFRESKDSTERDVFICVKISASTEKEKHGVNERTKDYEFALRAYKDLQARGKNVFFSFVTLKNEVGSDDLIWLNLVKSKKMLLIGSREDYLESAWVKSEWKRWRFLERRKDMYICVLNEGGDNPKNILPYELRKDAPQIYTPDTYEKLLDDICGVEYNVGIPSSAVAAQATATQATATAQVFSTQAPMLYRNTAMPASLNAIVEKIEADEKEKAAYAGKDGKIVYKDGREEVLKYGIHMIKANQYAKGDDIVKVIIPDSVTEIGEGAFQLCTELRSIIIPDSVNIIDSYAFGCCLKIRHLTLPESLSRIIEDSFRTMSNLESVYIPKRVCAVYKNAFNGCNRLKSVYFGGDMEEWKNITVEEHNDPIETAALHFLEKKTDDDGKIVYKDGRVEVLKYGITKIEDGSYRDNEDIISVVLPDGVTDIGNVAFSGCNRLLSIEVPASVKRIGSSFCTNYAKIYFRGEKEKWKKIMEDSATGDVYTKVYYSGKILYSDNREDILEYDLTAIEENAYYGRKDIVSVTLPHGITNIGAGAFFGCTNIKTVYYYGTKDEWKNITIGYNNECLTNAELCTDGKVIYNDGSEETIEYGVTKIVDSSNYINESYRQSDIVYKNWCELIKKEGFIIDEYGYKRYPVSIVMPDSVESCNMKTSPIEHIELSKNMYSVPTLSESKIKSLNIPEGVQSMGGGFYRCKELKEVYIPASVEKIDSNPFIQCNPKVTISPENKHYKVIGNDIYTIDGKELIAHIPEDGETHYVIPCGVTTIGYNAFRHDEMPVSIEIPNSVTKIYRNQCSECIKHVYFNGKKSEWSRITTNGSTGVYPFSDNTQLHYRNLFGKYSK